MFKIIGFIFLTTATIAICTKRCLKDLCTYKFLNQSVRLLKILRLERNTGKTYPQILHNMDITKLSYYSSFKFENRKDFFTNLTDNELLEKVRVLQISDTFSQLGQRNYDKEKQFIEQNVEILQLSMEDFKNRYYTNRKLNTIFGFSLGTVVFILLV